MQCYSYNVHDKGLSNSGEFSLELTLMKILSINVELIDQNVWLNGLKSVITEKSEFVYRCA